jgi:hypothetical protein
MKIAICLYGQPRLYEKGYINIKNFIDLNNTHSFDSFFHTWYDDNMIGQYYQCAPWRNISKAELEIKSDTIDNLINLYEPKEYMYESPKIFDTSIYNNTDMFLSSSDAIKQNINNTISSIYSKYQVSNLLKKYVDNKSIIYDFIISIRFDFLNELIFTIEDLKKDVINCMNVYPRLYIVDNLIITNYDLFMKVSNTYLNLLQIMNNNKIKEYFKQISETYVVINESLITANLKLYYNDLHKIIYMNSKIPNFV